MSEGLNRVMLLGNLGADPELRVTSGGQAILKLRLATTESYLDSSNARQERTEWHQVTLFGKRGEALAKFLTKGERIFVEGRIQTSTYEKDGEKRYRTEVVATNVILSGRGDGQANDDREAPPARRQQQQRQAPQRAPQDDFGGYPADDDVPF
jgi:single-strand DNA-binding protein